MSAKVPRSLKGLQKLLKVRLIREPGQTRVKAENGRRTAAVLENQQINRKIASLIALLLKTLRVGI